MASFSLPFYPANTTAVTTISNFPENPKFLILKQCKTLKDLNQVHAHLIKTRLHLNPSVAENLLESAAVLLRTSTMDYAWSIFDNLIEPDSSLYNVMIRGFTVKQSPDQAMLLFRKMMEDCVEPDGFTFPCVLKACSRVKGIEEGKQIHAQILKRGSKPNDEFVGNSLIHMYASCGQVAFARMVFDAMPKRNIVSWNSMYSGYSKSGCWEDVLKLFYEMRGLGVGFDEVTMISVLTACGSLADLKLGEWISEYIEANRVTRSLNLMTALVDMYAKCGNLDAARRLFDQMWERDVVTWTAMISGYNQVRRCKEALNLFKEMQKTKVDPNEVTMVSVLSSCAILGALDTGKWVHLYIVKKKMKLTVTLGTALIDFYARCGEIDKATEVFEKMPLKNVFSWTALIQGLANNGQGRRALESFHLMCQKGVEPNDVTFIGVLSACSHAGLVDEGRKCFSSMSKDFGIKPRMEHYGCMIDILGRAGLIEEAYAFAMNMHIQPNAVIWRTLLASCKAHKNVEIGERSLKHLVKLEPLHSGDYILLSNIYASAGRLEDALRVRNQMREKRIKKTPGCSVIELDGVVHEFFAEDDAHPLSEEIYKATKHMIEKIKYAGYVPNTADGRLDAEEDDKEVSVSHHSEKLAIAFGLFRTPPGSTIRISKNLRVCTDCHNAMKIVSKVYKREITVRDRNRFHHFREGFCSCNDFW